MVSELTVLDPSETETILGKTETIITRLADTLVPIADSESSVFVTGLSEGTIQSLRTRMSRKGFRVTTRLVKRNGVKGHVIQAKRTGVEV